MEMTQGLQFLLIFVAHPVIDQVPWRQSLRQGFGCVLLLKKRSLEEMVGSEGSRTGKGEGVDQGGAFSWNPASGEPLGSPGM